MKRIAIIGAGISGLTLAYRLKGRCEVQLFDKSSRSGGWIRSSESSGFLCEQGPRGVRPRAAGLHTVALIEDLGLQNQVAPADIAANTRYLLKGGRLVPLPHSLFSFLQHPHLIKALWKDYRAPKAGIEEETLFAFVSRRFGERIANEYLDPMVSGIYAGDPKKLLASSCFPLLTDYEKEYGSVVWGMLRQKSAAMSAYQKKMHRYPLISFKKGMQTLTDHLAREVENELHLEHPVTSLDQIDADQIVSTLPAHQLSELLGVKGFIHSTSMVCVNLCYGHPVLPKKGFGYLVPSNEGEKVLGAVWDSMVFPDQNLPGQTRVTVMIGGVRHEEKLELADEVLISMAKQAMYRHVGVSCEPDLVCVTRARQAIPQFEKGHSQWKQAVTAANPQFTIAGTSFSGVAVNDCVRYADHLAEKLVPSYYTG